MPTATIRLGAAFECDEHRDVLARSRGGQQLVLESQGFEALPPRGCAVLIGVHDQLRPAGQDPIRGGVHVADHEVGRQPGLEQRVPASVHADQHRAEVADVRPQGSQVVPVVGAAHDDQGMAIAEVRAQLGDLQAPREDVPLVADVLERVLGEVMDRLADAVLLLAGDVAQLGDTQHPSLDQDAVGPDHGAAADRHRVAVGELLEQRRVHRVDERDARAGQDQRPRVRIAAAGRRRDVHDRLHAALDEILGRHAVEVGVIDHGNVLRRQPADEVLRAPAESRRPLHLRHECGECRSLSRALGHTRGCPG